MSNWASRFPVYQIDFQAVASGKRVASTKRRVRWRFGFPNRQALDAGRTGIECRGEEHDIVIVWSITSGKRQVTMDGQEVHFSISRSGVLEHSWASRGNHVLKIIAHAAPPIQAVPGFRQYDFLIDGQSFFSMPKVYELGLRRPAPGYERDPGVHSGQPYVSSPPSGYHSYPSSAPVSNIPAPRTRREEEDDLQRAINASLQESRQFLEKTQKRAPDDRSAASAPQPTAAPQDLLDFGGEQAVPASTPRSMADTQTITSFSSMPAPQLGAATSPYMQQPSQFNAFAVPPSHQPNQQFPQIANSAASVVTPSNMSHQAPAVASSYPVTSFAHQPAPAAPAGSSYPPQNAPVVGYPTSPNQQEMSSAMGAGYAPPQYHQPVPTGPTIDAFAAPAPSSDVFGLHQPLPPADDPFAPKPPPLPTQQDIHNVILGAYGPSESESPAPPPSTTQYPGQAMAIENGPNQGNANMTLNGGLGNIGRDNEPRSEVEVAMKKLVNFDSIDQPVDSLYTLDQKKKEEEKERMKHKGKSKGLPPVSVSQGMNVGQQASLDQIKAVKPEKKKTPEEIMKAAPQLFHPNAAMAGALVVHGQGPPPLQPQGFGVGYRSFQYHQ